MVYSRVSVQSACNQSCQKDWTSSYLPVNNTFVARLPVPPKCNFYLPVYCLLYLRLCDFFYTLEKQISVSYIHYLYGKHVIFSLGELTFHSVVL